MTKQRVLIAEDHAILRDGLRSLLSSDEDIEIAGEAVDGREAVLCVRNLRPDIVLMDLSMPRLHGVEALREIKKVAPETKILVLTVHENEEYISATLEAGVNGYLLKKDATHAELLRAIKAISKGRVYLSPAVSEKLVEGYLQGRKGVRPKSTWETLTAREREILKLIAEGYRTKEIADFLCISVKTAENHRANLMRKLDLHNVAAVTAFAMEKGLIGE
ncbi:MAG: response regulator transcription factor [Thermodesulfobacteriota bacterium]